MRYSMSRGKAGELIIRINDIGGWDGFEEIVHFFQREFDAEVVSKFDAPDETRLWDLAIKGQIITFVHDDLMGNAFFSRSPLGETLVENLALSYQNLQANQ